MQRVVVIGTTGSGKSTLGAALAERLGIEFVELDALFWQPNWVQTETPLLRELVAEAIRGDQWVVSGNNHRVRDLIWSRADTLIWLDYPFLLIFGRLFRRTIKRIVTREDLWETGNVETWRAQFLSRDSLFVWLLKSYRRRKRETPLALGQPEFSHLQVIHFTSARAADIWLQHVQPTIAKEHA